MNWLLLRGLGREQRHWHDFPERLATRLGTGRVTMLDLAGTGTEHRRRPLPSVSWLARDVAERLPRSSEAGAAPWHVLGLSLGGMVALELCWLLPASFAAAVVINSSSRLSPACQRLRPSALPALLRIARARAALVREAGILEVTSRLSGVECSRWAREGAAIASEAPVARSASLAQLLAAARFQAPERGQITARLLFLASRRDALVNCKASRRLAGNYGATYEEHVWAGHDLPLDDPEWVCERVARFRDALGSSVT